MGSGPQIRGLGLGSGPQIRVLGLGSGPQIQGLGLGSAPQIRGLGGLGRGLESIIPALETEFLLTGFREILSMLSTNVFF